MIKGRLFELLSQYDFFIFLHHYFNGNKTQEASDFWLRGINYTLTNYKLQNGTKRYPARSCRELHLDHPDYPSGMY